MTQNPMIADVSEATAFLDAHPDMQFFEIIYTGLSGVPRGKRLRRHELTPLYENGRFLPSSMLVTDITGQDVEQTGLIWQGGDADKIGRPIPGRLAMAPWLGSDIAQIPLSVYELDNSPIGLDPRHVLARVIERFVKDGLTPVVACELEFFMLDQERTPSGGVQLARWPLTGARPTQHDQYSLREMQEAAPFLQELWAASDALGVPLEGAISEYAPGQLELTLKHHDDALRSADDAILTSTPPRAWPRSMAAKPPSWPSRSPSRRARGMHMHVSVNDSAGKNIFASEAAEGSPELGAAIGGMKALLADSMAILAPNANSYRRFRANSYAPVAPVWGVNNRTCAFRVPAGQPRTPATSSTASPALTPTQRWRSPVLLAAVHHGIAQKLDPGPPVTGDGYAHAEATGERIPANWFAAVDRFEQSAVLRDYLGETASSALMYRSSAPSRSAFSALFRTSITIGICAEPKPIHAPTHALEAAQRPRDRRQRRLYRLDRDRRGSADAVGLWVGERVLVVSNTTGARLETYTIAGKRGSRIISMNGAAAHTDQDRRANHRHGL